MRRVPAEKIPTLPAPVRHAARSGIWAFGRATSRFRPLPDFLVIGAQKAGTTALYAYLRWHPSITGPSWKEVSYFDRHYARGAAWYRGNFPLTWSQRSRRRTRPDRIVGEASPSYLFHPLAAERVKALVPEARLVVLLRDPVDRALSHYQHELALGRETLPFEEAIAQEEARTHGEVERMLADPAYFSRAWWDFTYLERGRYAEQLERWLAAFPREQLLVLASDELANRPADTYKRVLDFLGAPPHELDAYPRVFEREYDDMAPPTRQWLAAYYEEPNRRLSALAGRDFGWTRSRASPAVGSPPGAASLSRPAPP
jgi:hypothetical protein